MAIVHPHGMDDMAGKVRGLIVDGLEHLVSSLKDREPSEQTVAALKLLLDKAQAIDPALSLPKRIAQQNLLGMGAA